jgi:hypothetical protein
MEGKIVGALKDDVVRLGVEEGGDVWGCHAESVCVMRKRIAEVWLMMVGRRRRQEMSQSNQLGPRADMR